jgi:hypothetical protein
VYSSALAEALPAFPSHRQLDSTGPWGLQSKKFDRGLAVEVVVSRCKYNALPSAGVNHAASQQRFTPCMAGAKVGLALDFFA